MPPSFSTYLCRSLGFNPLPIVVFGVVAVWHVSSAGAIPFTSGYTKVWEDNFELSSVVHGKPNPDKWQSRFANNTRTADSGNDMLYKTGAHFVTSRGNAGDGKLRVLTYTTPAGDHASSYITTRFNEEGDAWNKGYFEARIKFHTKPGTWGAFWLNGENVAANPPTPAEQDGVEMDVIEHRRVNGNNQYIGDSFRSTFHWDGYGADQQTQPKTTAYPNDDPWDWHVYGLQWTGSHYKIFLDEQQVWWTGNQVPISNTPEFITLSMGMKDGGWAGDVPSGGYGSYNDRSTNSYFEVDWVRVYKRNDQPLINPEPSMGALLLLSAGPLRCSRRRRRKVSPALDLCRRPERA